MGIAKLLVYSIFRKEKEAERAVKALVNEEFAAANIHVLVREAARTRSLKRAKVRTKTLVGPGIAIGASLGAVGGALVVASGGAAAAPLGVLYGAVSGGAAGTLAGTVGGLGYWRDVVEFPELEAGAFLVGVDLAAQGQAERARKALRSAGAAEVHTRSWQEAAEEVRQA